MTKLDTKSTEGVACAAATERQHFCTCDDIACPLNPNNPRNREQGKGCDACIRKNLAHGEIPTCFFKSVSDLPEGWGDFTVEGFVRHCLAHGIGTAEQAGA